MGQPAETALAINTRVTSVAQQPKFRDEWDKERKKLKILSAIFIVVLAVVGVLFAISVLHGHL